MAGHRARGQPLREHPCSRCGRPLLCVVPAGGARGLALALQTELGAGPHPAKAPRLQEAEAGCLSPAQDPSLYISQQLLPPPPALPPLPGILGAGGTSDARLAGEAPAAREPGALHKAFLTSEDSPRSLF